MSAIPPPDHEDFVEARSHSLRLARARMEAMRKNRPPALAWEGLEPEDGIYIGKPRLRYRIWKYLHRKGWL